MSLWNLLRFAVSSLTGHRLRSLLSVLGIAIGIGSITILTALGQGAQQYMVDMFMQFGTNIVQINPGKVKTMGVPGLLGGTTHPLTIEDAVSLYRVPGVTHVVPLSMGMAEVSHGNRGRSVYAYGVNHQLPAVWKFQVGQGSFLPEMDPRRQASVAVLGPTVKRELFGEQSPLGKHVRVGGRRFRVVGVMEPKGNMLGLDMDDAIYLPVASALTLFNQPELIEIDLLYQKEIAAATMEQRLTEHMKRRHRGEEDVTITTQEGMLVSLNRILATIAAAVTAIGGISLLVGAIGIMSIMWITVNERTREIGLLKAIGAREGQIRLIFFAESAWLSILGGMIGLGGGIALAALLELAVPAMPVSIPYALVIPALALCTVIGILSGVLPASRAAGLDPVEALRAE